MAQGEFYVATTGPISGPIFLDGLALVVRDPQMAVLLVRQIRGWSEHVFPAPLATNWATPPIPVNVDGLLVHPRQVERDQRTLSMYFFPEENLHHTERAFLARSPTRRFLTLENPLVRRTPEQSWVERARLQAEGRVVTMAELVSAAHPATTALPKLPQPETIADLRARRIRRRRM